MLECSQVISEDAIIAQLPLMVVPQHLQGTLWSKMNVRRLSIHHMPIQGSQDAHQSQHAIKSVNAGFLLVHRTKVMPSMPSGIQGMEGTVGHINHLQSVMLLR